VDLLFVFNELISHSASMTEPGVARELREKIGLSGMR
jgi:hypothetical protein